MIDTIATGLSFLTIAAIVGVAHSFFTRKFVELMICTVAVAAASGGAGMAWALKEGPTTWWGVVVGLALAVFSGAAVIYLSIDIDQQILDPEPDESDIPDDPPQ